MRTTIQLNDQLLLEAKQHAAQTGRTLKAVIEDALREALARTEATRPQTRVSLKTFKGRGVQPGVDFGRYFVPPRPDGAGWWYCLTSMSCSTPIARKIPDHPAYRDWLEELIHSPQALRSNRSRGVQLSSASPPTSRIFDPAQPAGHSADFCRPNSRSSQSRSYRSRSPPLGDIYPALPTGAVQGESGTGRVLGCSSH